MELKIIKTEKQNAKALKELERLIDINPKKNSAESHKLEVLQALIQKFEKRYDTKKQKGGEAYFVTAIDKNEDTRCTGYYPTLKQARALIGRSFALLSDFEYNKYAVIEKFSYGGYPHSEFQEWYKLTKKKAVKISTPKQFKNVCNFGLG